MTAQHRRIIICEKCGQETTEETGFGRWLRAQDALPSFGARECFVFSDIDYVVHRYMWNGSRNKQIVMLIEVKTNDAPISNSQGDTLYKLNALLTDYQRHEQACTGVPLGRYTNGSVDKSNLAYIKCAGVHVLTMSGDSPDNSRRIVWGRKKITSDQLVRILRFDIHPKTMKKNPSWDDF